MKKKMTGKEVKAREREKVEQALARRNNFLQLKQEMDAFERARRDEWNIGLRELEKYINPAISTAPGAINLLRTKLWIEVRPDSIKGRCQYYISINRKNGRDCFVTPQNYERRADCVRSAKRMAKQLGIDYIGEKK